MTKHPKEKERLKKIIEAFPKVTITVVGDHLVLRPARTVFAFQAPQRPPRQSGRRQVAEKSAWADAAASDPPNRRPDAA